MIWYFINCNWVVTRWQQYSTHLHTNNTQSDTKQTIHRTTQQLGNNTTYFLNHNGVGIFTKKTHNFNFHRRETLEHHPSTRTEDSRRPIIWTTRSDDVTFASAMLVRITCLWRMLDVTMDYNGGRGFSCSLSSTD